MTQVKRCSAGRTPDRTIAQVKTMAQVIPKPSKTLTQVITLAQVKIMSQV